MSISADCDNIVTTPIDVRPSGLTPEEIVSPRFWEMRKFLVDFGRARLTQQLQHGDMVTLTHDFYSQPEKDTTPWIVMGLTDGGVIGFDGHVIIANGMGQMMRIPMWSTSLYLTVVSRAADAVG